MKLSEIEQKCKQFNAFQQQCIDGEAEAAALQQEDYKQKEDFEVRKMLAMIRGESFASEFKNEPLLKVKAEISSLKESLLNQEKDLLKALKQLNLDVISDIPMPNSSNEVEITFGDLSFEYSESFIARIMNTDGPIKLDAVTFNPKKMLITGVHDRKETASAIITFLENIKRLAMIALNEEVPGVAETAEYMNENEQRRIVWEKINGRRIISQQTLYAELGIVEDTEKKKNLRNFFTNTKITLKENYPFTIIGDGNYELNFIGMLVWKYYKTKYQNSDYSSESSEKVTDDPKVQNNPKENKTKNNKPKTEMATLNGFLDDKKISETLYGANT
jgi:hypothetical protein